MSTNNMMMSKKVRTEYMKKFRDPKWETFSKCYEDCVKYRLTRRMMEQTHLPLFGDGWDSSSDSSGRSSPKFQVMNISNGKHYISSSESKEERVVNGCVPQVNGEVHSDGAATMESSAPLENGLKVVTANGPSIPKRRPRHRAPRSEPCYPKKELDSEDSQPPTVRKPSRAKSQPPSRSKETPRRPFSRYDWAERHVEPRERKMPSLRMSMSAGEIHRADVAVQTRGKSERRGRALDQRRARSADLEKYRRAADERWTTEYMRCFTPRVR